MSDLLQQEYLSHQELELAFEKSRKKHTITPQDLDLRTQVQLWIYVASITLPDFAGPERFVKSSQRSLGFMTRTPIQTNPCSSLR
jgi:hypothetical protein